MDIFLLILKSKFYQNILQNAPNCIIKKNVSGEHGPNPLASNSPKLKKRCPPMGHGKSCICPCGTMCAVNNIDSLKILVRKRIFGIWNELLYRQ